MELAKKSLKINASILFVADNIIIKKILINGDGKQIVDMIYVRDLAKIMYLAFEKEVWGEVFDAGSGRPRTV